MDDDENQIRGLRKDEDPKESGVYDLTGTLNRISLG
jgi:hypothetical protein